MGTMTTGHADDVPVHPRWRRRLDTARHVLRTVGARGVAFLLLQRTAPSPSIHPEWFVVLEHDTRTAGPDDEAPDMRWGTLADLPQLLSGERDEEMLRARFAHGDRVAILGDDDLVGYAWYREEEYDEQGILFRLGPREVWGYDAWIAEGHRSRGHASRMLRAISRALAGEGITRVLLSVDHLNEASLRAMRSAGRFRIGSIWMLRVFGISLRREAWDGARPRWSLYREFARPPTPAIAGGGPPAA